MNAPTSWYETNRRGDHLIARAIVDKAYLNDIAPSGGFLMQEKQSDKELLFYDRQKEIISELENMNLEG